MVVRCIRLYPRLYPRSAGIISWISTATEAAAGTFAIDGDALITFIAGTGQRPVQPIKITFRGRRS